jgi:integrase/recombinase XerD
MANRECNVTKRVQTARGPRYCRVVLAANGRIKPDHVLVGEKVEVHRDGAYYLEWREGTQRVRLSVGNDAAEASARRQRKEAELNAIANGVPLATGAEGDGSDKRGATLKDALREFLDEKKSTRKAKTHADYETTLEYFQQSCAKRCLSEVTRKDLLAFTVYCREELELSPRTVFNKFARVVAFLRAQKIKLHEKGDAPKFVEEEPEVYEREDLDKLFAACDADERLWFEFFLMTGMREQEVMHTHWRDVNLKASTVRISYKSEHDWSPKAYKGREIPIPAKLVASLKAWKTRSNGSCELLFHTAGCNPKLDFLDCLKAVATRAGLDKDDFWLHKFRATFATWHLWAGVDLRTVQLWMGHSDLESTMRYLKPSRSQQTHDRVNATFA